LSEPINDTVKELIARSLAGDISSSQQRELQAWLDKSPGNQKVFDSFKAALNLTDQNLGITSGKNLPIDVDAEWKVFLDNVQASETPVRPLYSFSWVKIAASLLLLAFSSYVVYYFIGKNSLEEFRTADTSMKVELPDGSSVILNRFSSLSYEKNFGDGARTLTFNGEGFFEVTPDTNKPFLIHLRNAIVEVVGTSFNILAYDTSAVAEVTVKTGIVKFTGNKISQFVSLKAGEVGSYNQTNQKLTSSLNDDVNYLSWQTHEIIFEETSLSRVIETLNKTYGSHLVLSSNVSDSCVVTVSFSNQSLESVLNVLKNTLNLEYSVKGNVIEITAPGC